MTEKKSVCVVGAGLSGLPSIKCLHEAGLKVTCYEKEHNIAGRWHKDNNHSIPRSTVTNLTRNLSCYSDFPIPEEYPLYFSADTFCRYLELYAERFGLMRFIKLDHIVLNLTPLMLNDQMKWQVTYTDQYQKECQEEYDFVLVSSGFYAVPFVPNVINDALSSFKGRIIHSIDYKGWKEFKQKTVVVCGLGNTGGDIVSDIADHGKQAYISTSNGATVLNRIANGGIIPMERSRNRVTQYIPSFMKQALIARVITNMSNSIYNQDKLCLTARYMTNVIINDEICIRIACGKIKVKPSIRKTVGNTVYFTNGTTAENVDAIILCTGYKRNFPFFEDDLIPMEHNGKHIPLYKNIFTTKFRESLAFVGMYSVLGSATLTSEMQARYAAAVFRQTIILPNNLKMEESIVTAKTVLQTSLCKELKEYNLHTNPWAYYDSLATEIGCRPSLLWILFTDPKLAWQMIGSYAPFEYRLCGPNSWPGARNAIMNQSKIMYAFMNGSREVPTVTK